MANTITTHACFVCQHGTHPLIDSTLETIGTLVTDLVSWILCSVGCVMLRCLALAKHIVEDWLIYYLLCGHILCLMLKQTSTLLRKFVRSRNRCLASSRNLVLLILDRLCIHTNMQLRSECKWQPSNAANGYVLDKACEAYTRNLRFSSSLFVDPHECLKSRLKKPPDRLIFAIYVPVWITIVYAVHVMIGVMKIWYLGVCKAWHWLRNTWIATQKATSVFASNRCVYFT